MSIPDSPFARRAEPDWALAVAPQATTGQSCINACRFIDMTVGPRSPEPTVDGAAKAAGLFRLLGDDARLRILRLLDAERLNVTELTSILGIAQSGVSRHLGLLKDAGLVEERRDAGFTFFRLAPGRRDGSNGFGPLWPLLQSHFDAASATPSDRAHDRRLEDVRRAPKQHFDDHGADHELLQ